MWRIVRLLWCTAGIYTFFLAWAYLQQRITAKPFVTADGSELTFRAISFLNLVQAFSAAAAAKLVLVVRGSKADGVATRQYVLTALSNTLASPCGYGSLYFTSYLFLAVGKACKLVPVMAFDFVMNKARFSKLQVASVTLISAGIVVFKLHNKSAAVGGVPVLATLAGCGLILANLAFDGYTSGLQTRLLKDGKARYAEAMAKKEVEAKTGEDATFVTSYHLMYNVNKWAVVLLAGWLLAMAAARQSQSELATTIEFIRQVPEILPLVVVFGLLGAGGQLFIFDCITRFGALACTTVCITRKFFSILISIYMFPEEEPMPWMGWVGILAVFGGLSMSVLDKWLKQRSKSPAQVKKQE